MVPLSFAAPRGNDTLNGCCRAKPLHTQRPDNGGVSGEDYCDPALPVGSSCDSQGHSSSSYASVFHHPPTR
ncbi:hypothetical protein [Candidatus Oscillochloris fontis]|uniref:hypothetical protein n=1 Tax=Candidatus Oscillochloris fontis TaxID=2496868 RepID=UPI00101B8BB3|nr:hypothetical protein [Candidatus Oscillochloris fontis]